MKKRIAIVLLLIFLLSGCSKPSEEVQIAATTLPVYEFTVRLCEGTPLHVTRLITENVSCLHDYTLKVSQMRTIESAQVVVLSGAGLEDFMDSALRSASCRIDASQGIALLETEESHDMHEHAHDPHIWLSPENAKIMASNICSGLTSQFPQYAQVFQTNLSNLHAELDALQRYGETALSHLPSREIVTFHDGFSYFAEAFGLRILAAVEEESGSEAPASELIELISLVERSKLPAIFTETNGSTAAAQIIARETGCKVFSLDTAMAADGYFSAMYHNIDTIREAYAQ